MKLLRFVGKSNTESSYQEALADVAVRKVDFHKADGNISVDFSIDDKWLELPMLPAVRDLVDLAATVYIADELQARPQAWTRGFEIVMPARKPAVWQNASRQLEDLLYFLAGDRFRFDWLATKTVPPLSGHRATIPSGFDTVCLFSGGADSLVGAYELLEEGRRVLLVGHQAEGITSSTQDKVIGHLRRRFGDQVVFIQARVARSKRATPTFDLGRKVETTHRPRSFLFLSLGVAVAAAAGAKEIVIPENGLIALNSPLNISRVGTLSTRTAHPKMLSGFNQFVKDIGVFQGRIYNPFLYLSKTDVIKRAKAPLKKILPATLSCSHLGRERYWPDFDGHHCGYCIPCLYRRAALAAVDLDSPANYYCNVFGKFKSLSVTERSDVRALVSFAKRVQRMSVAQRMLAALAHGACDIEGLKNIGPSTNDPLKEWADMLKRWSEEFLAQARAWASPEARRGLDL